jgi:solute carrier family 35 protein E3
MFMGSPLQASIAISLAVLCAGIGTATMGNVVSFSFLGTVFGCLAPIAGAANVLFIKHVQSEFDLLGNDLLKAIAPWVVASMVALIPVTDDLSQLSSWMTTEQVTGVMVVLLSCVLAWGLEWSYVVVVHATSAMTMQVLGHVKTVCIIATGYLLFNAPLTKRAAAGTCIALVAVGMYTWIKNQRAPNSTPDSKFEVPPLERVPDDYAPLKSSGARPNPPRSPAGRAEALPGIPVASDGAALCR